VYHFVEGGTEAGLTVRANRRAFEQVQFLPRAAVCAEPSPLRTTVLGCDLALPVVVSPAGYIRLAHRGGEVAAARAAGRVGTAIGISTLSSYAIEEITAATAGPVFYQLYFAGGRAGAEVAIDRAKQAGCRALIVTVDLAAAATRERALPGGAIPTAVDLAGVLRYGPEMVRRPRWVADFLRGGLRLDVPNVRTTPDGPPLSAAAASKSMRGAAPTWSDLAWIREQWQGPVLIKGLLTADDACRARDAGADAVSVSNHGGNALDGTPAALKMLPAVVSAVGGEVEVLMDGGVRRGSDVVKALALGAKAVLVGRAYIWGLAAGGEDGVVDVLRILEQGVHRTLALLGCPRLDDLDQSFVTVPSDWPTEKLADDQLGGRLPLSRVPLSGPDEPRHR
jgi:isopentenyl diphosphate isomerase/L-lactate dehydrogenase-like FMN-dependent dehydrogenase